MFLQTIIGQVADVGDVENSLRRWAIDLAPGARGWLGTTAGLTEDGTFVALVLFSTREAARRNSDRPEQHQWWMRTAKAFVAEPHFLDGEQVVTFGGGPSPRAGFVQVIRSHGANFQRIVSLMEPVERDMSAYRPEILGAVSSSTADGQMVDAIYFTSENAARDGERRPVPSAVQQAMAEADSLATVDGYLDLRVLWHFAPPEPRLR